MKTKEKLNGNAEQVIEKVLEDIALSQKISEEKQNLIQSLDKGLIQKKLRGETPYVESIIYRRHEYIKFGVRNPGKWTVIETGFFFFGPNFIQENDRALLSVDTRYPTPYQTKYIAAGDREYFEFDISFFYWPSARDSEIQMMTNFFVGNQNSFGPGNIHDRASYMIPVPRPE